MSFKKNFCPSPWFHARINNNGSFEYCRWAHFDQRHNESNNIKKQDPIYWFQQGSIKDIRKSLIEGESPVGCKKCLLQEHHGKVNGRLRQLLKIGVTVDEFEKSLLSSPWIDEFKEFDDGTTDLLPQDWQIDLGNFCNSGCLMCSPHYSSYLSTEFYKIGLIQQKVPPAWCHDPELLNKFLVLLKKSPRLTYLHFIGGETLITPAFKIILKALVDAGLNKSVTIGFTTNLTTWDQSTIDLLSEFKSVNLGLSIECVHPLNDYVRYGGKISETMEIIEKWMKVAEKLSWLVQIRVTPSVLTIYHLDTIYDWALTRKVSIESCDFLMNPEFMRISVLPKELRTASIEKLSRFVKNVNNDQLLVNTRDPTHQQKQMIQDVQSYINYLTHQPDESFRLPELVKYLKIIEHNRKNSVLDYLPEYEEILRSAGY